MKTKDDVVIGSLSEYDRRFFPGRYSREMETQRLQDDLGTGLAESFVAGFEQCLKTKSFTAPRDRVAKRRGATKAHG